MEPQGSTLPSDDTWNEARDGAGAARRANGEPAYVLRIAHSVRDYNAWKAAFDADPAGRRAGGVRRYRVLRPVEEPNFVLIDLEFDALGRAETFRAGLLRLWGQVQGKLIGSPESRILEVAESRLL